MDLVTDANIIFAALIKESKTHELIFDENLHLFTTEFFFTEFKKHSEELQEKLGILVEPKYYKVHDMEFPDVPDKQIPKVGRNKKCPCGSGVKYKKCHGINS